MVVSEVRDFLEQMGYQVQTTITHREHMQLWREWYRGKVDAFHNYKVYTGVKEVKKTKKSLGMAKKACEDWADLLLNEKVKITIDSMQEHLDGILKENDFREQANVLLEKTFALGTGAFVEYKSSDINNNCCINYISADMIFPLRIANGRIVDVAFASEISNGKYYVNIHEKKGDKYRIENIIISSKRYGKYQISELPKGIENVYYSPVPLFQIIKPNIANNSDMDEPMGLSVFANATDEMMDVDEKFDSYFNEFQLGKKRIFVDPSSINVVPTVDNENTKPVFDPDDIAFYGVAGLGEDNKRKIEQTDFDLRVEQHSLGLQDSLNLFSDKVGFGTNYYVFKEGKIYTNTTDIISSNSKMFRRLKKHEIILRRALEELVRAVLYISVGQVYSGIITIDFDDSIIEDKEAERKQYKEDVALGAMSLLEYRMKVYNEDKNTAQSMLPQQADVMQ